LLLLSLYSAIYPCKPRLVKFDPIVLAYRGVAYILSTPVNLAASLVVHLPQAYLIFRAQQFLNNQVAVYLLKFPVEVKMQFVAVFGIAFLAAFIFLYMTGHVFYSLLILNTLTFFLSAPLYAALGRLNILNRHNFMIGLGVLIALLAWHAQNHTLDTIIIIELLILGSRLYLLRARVAF
jgi:hypothetical protein